MSQYLRLGTFDLTDLVYDNIKPAGGYFDIKQDNAITLRTGARKGDPKGTNVGFFVCFDTEADASAFLAYVAPYSPEDPDFDEDEGANIDLFLRSDAWAYKVWGVVVKSTSLNDKSPLDYLQWCYEVVCYLYSPYSGGPAQAFTIPGTEIIEIAINGDYNTPGDTVYGLNSAGAVVVLGPGGWSAFPYPAPVALVRLSADASGLLGLTAAGVAYLYAGGSWAQTFGGESGILDVCLSPIRLYGFAVTSDHKLKKWMSGDWIEIGGWCKRCAIKNMTEFWVIGSDDATWKYEIPSWGDPVGWVLVDSTPVSRIAIAADGAAYAIRLADGIALEMVDGAWGSLGKVASEVTARGLSEAHFVRPGGAWKHTTKWEAEGGTLGYEDNGDGHVASAPDIDVTCGYNSGHATNVIMDIDGDSLVLCDEALSDEVWSLEGNRNKLTEQFTAVFTSLARAQQDASGTFTKGDGNYIVIGEGQYATWKLSGPHKIKKPVRMTAQLHLFSGVPIVAISPDNVNWSVVVLGADFGYPAIIEHVLQGSEYMTDCYVGIYSPTGSSCACDYMHFEVERWVEDGAMPKVLAGETKLVAITATGGTLAVSGSFTPRQKFI